MLWRVARGSVAMLRSTALPFRSDQGLNATTFPNDAGYGNRRPAKLDIFKITL